MIDMGLFEPATETIPDRGFGSANTLSRLTTTDEQRAEAIKRMTQAAAEGGDVEVRATVAWSRQAPTILELRCVIEHIEGGPVYLPDHTLEMATSGAEIKHDEGARLRRLKDEVAELHERQML